MKDHYKTLGVSENATASEIKAAYHKLAKKMHPDLNPNNKEMEKRFQEVSTAYNTLSKKDSRDKYDQERKFSSYSQSQNQPNWNTGQNSHYSNFQNAGNFNFNQSNQQGFNFDFDLNDILNIFSKKTNTTKTGKDLLINITISFMDSVLGIQKEIKVKNKKLNIKIPPGAENNDIVTIPNKGESQPGHIPGDLKIKLKVDPHPIFQRRGHDIYIFIAKNSIENGTAIVPTIYGTVKIKVPNPIPDKIRLQGKGIRNNKKIGNQYITIS